MFDSIIIFIHGGPGLSSRAEETILGPIADRIGLKNLYFWNEPTIARGTKPESLSYENSIQSLVSYISSAVHGKDINNLILVGHSFGTFYAVEACRRLKISPKMLLCSPSLSMDRVEDRILKLALKFQEESGALGTVKTYLDKPSASFDEARFQALVEGLQTPGVLNRYLLTAEKFTEYFSMAVGEYAFDLQAYFAVRKSMGVPQAELSASPTMVIYGAHDPVIRGSEEVLELKNYYPELTQHTFESSAHYPHLEEAERFMQLLSEFANTPMPLSTSSQAEFSLTN